MVGFPNNTSTLLISPELAAAPIPARSVLLSSNPRRSADRMPPLPLPPTEIGHLEDVETVRPFRAQLDEPPASASAGDASAEPLAAAAAAATSWQRLLGWVLPDRLALRRARAAHARSYTAPILASGLVLEEDRSVLFDVDRSLFSSAPVAAAADAGPVLEHGWRQLGAMAAPGVALAAATAIAIRHARPALTAAAGTATLAVTVSLAHRATVQHELARLHRCNGDALQRYLTLQQALVHTIGRSLRLIQARLSCMWPSSTWCSELQYSRSRSFTRHPHAGGRARLPRLCRLVPPVSHHPHRARCLRAPKVSAAAPGAI